MITPFHQPNQVKEVTTDAATIEVFDMTLFCCFEILVEDGMWKQEVDHINYLLKETK